MTTSSNAADVPGPSPKSARLRTIAKWAWVAVVVSVAVVVLAQRWDEVSDAARELSVFWVVTGLGMTMLAKLGLAENARLAAVRSGLPMGFETAARLYNISQLGKYLPGGIWHFVGRAAAYRGMGAAYGRIRDALLTESLWIVGGAMVTGAMAAGVAVAVGQEAVPVLAAVDTVTRWWLAGGLALAVALTIAGLVWRRRAVVRYARTALPTPRAVAVQVAVWLVLGGAFWAFARAGAIDLPPAPAVAMFAFAFAIGFLVVFAPAGLGVRDGILVLGLVTYADEAQALVVVLVARAAYVVAELLLVALQEVLPRRRPLEALGTEVADVQGAKAQAADTVTVRTATP